MFTRTKHSAKRLTGQLIAAGVPAVELHGNLAQNARSRNLQAFSDGTAETLVATDIAARGIHVDDVRLVVHADPPVEHKAYLHRSGRTARAGADGTVVTLMTDDQVADVRDLTRKAAITATTTRTRPGDKIIADLAPGERSFVAPAPRPATEASTSRRSGGRRYGQPGESRGHGGAGRRSGAPAKRAAGSPSKRTSAPSARGAATRSPGGVVHTTSSAPHNSGSSSRSSGGAPRTSGGAPRSSGGAPRSSGGAPRTSGAAAFSASARPARRGR